MRPPLIRQNDSPKVPPNSPKPFNLADTRQVGTGDHMAVHSWNRIEWVVEDSRARRPEARSAAFTQFWLGPRPLPRPQPRRPPSRPEAGASLRELIERMGRASSRAALIYLHSTEERQRILVDAMSAR